MEILPWDTRFFGFPTARILPFRLGPTALADALTQLARAQVRLAYWFTDPADPDCAEAAAAGGGHLADVRLTYAGDPRKAIAGTWPVSVVPKDAPAHAFIHLAAIAGKYSRFHLDPKFPQELFTGMYEEWVRKSLSRELAHAVLAVELQGEQAGMITVSAREGQGEIGLLAVDSRHERMGLGSSLVAAAGAWFVHRGCTSAKVVTQGRNTSAGAVYEKHGYRLAKREHVYHFWLG